MNVKHLVGMHNYTTLFAGSFTVAVFAIYFIDNDSWPFFWLAALINTLVMMGGWKVFKIMTSLQRYEDQFLSNLQLLCLSDAALNETNALIAQLGVVLECETNEKVSKAIRLFMLSDSKTRIGIVVHGYGFTGKLTAPQLHEHFHTLDAKGVLDYFILDMEEDLER